MSKTWKARHGTLAAPQLRKGRANRLLRGALVVHHRPLHAPALALVGSRRVRVGKRPADAALALFGRRRPPASAGGECQVREVVALVEVVAVGRREPSTAVPVGAVVVTIVLLALRAVVVAALAVAELRVAAASEAARQQLIDARAAAVKRGAEEPRELPNEWVAKNGGFAADFGASITGSKSYRR